MTLELDLLQRHRDKLFEQILLQAELYLRHNVQECRSRRNEGNRWLFRCGMQQGIYCALDHTIANYHDLTGAEGVLAQKLFEFKKEVVETCQLMPHKAMYAWGLTELEDRLDIEKEDVICGLQHGLCAVANNLPRLLKSFANKKGPLAGASAAKYLGK